MDSAAPGPVDVEYQYDTPADDDEAIAQARERVRQALDAIVAQTRQDFAAEWKEWERANSIWGWRGLLRIGNAMEGHAKGIKDWAVGTAETIWQVAVLLAKGNQEVAEISKLVVTGEWEALDQKIADYRAQGEKVLAAASKIKEELILIFHDEKMRELFPQFVAQWWEAIPPDEQAELKARYGTLIAIDIVISVLLAAFTAGSAGAAYGGARWAATVGRLGAKATKLLDELKEAFKGLAQALKVRKRSLVERGRTADSGGVIESRWEGKVRGEKVEFPGVKTRKLDYEKRDRAETQKLRREFDSNGRKEFLQSTVSDPNKVQALKDAGLTDADITKMQSGRVPEGWSVHHKSPLDDGGTNAMENLVLIKEAPYHQAVTNTQRTLTGSMKVGDSKVVDWPDIPGFVYPPKP